MKRLNFNILALLLALCVCLPAAAQNEKHLVRKGNRQYGGGKFRESAASYGKAAAVDSNSFAAQYNLASSLYRLEDWKAASDALGKASSVLPSDASMAADCHYNSGDVALQQKDYAAAVKAFREALLLRPDDLDAKENYIYAKKMLENQQNGEGGQGDGGQNGDDRQNDQNQQEDQNQQKDQDGNGQDRQNPSDNQNQSQGDSGQGTMTPQQAQRVLNAIQAAEKKTQDKVNAEKAEKDKSRQKEKNW